MKQKTMQVPHYEKLCSSEVKLFSPLEIYDDLYFVTPNGDILKLKDCDPKEELIKEFHLGGQPSSIAFDDEGQLYFIQTLQGKNIFIADVAHQAVLARQLDDKGKGAETPEIAKYYEEVPLIGPNSIVCSTEFKCLYFTDSGQFGETTIEIPKVNKVYQQFSIKGSVYMIDFNDAEGSFIRSLALNCLAFPAGLVQFSINNHLILQALSKNEKILYVCEMGKNRILRFVLSNQNYSFFSTFIQLSGRFGPMDIVVSNNNEHLYIAQYDFKKFSKDGLISVYTQKGIHVEDIVLPNAPQISGISFSINNPSQLYVTNNTENSCCYKVFITREEKEEDEDLKK